MKQYLTLLAAGLCGISMTHAQTTTTGSSATATNSTYTSPVTTDSTNATGGSLNSTSPSSTSYGNASDVNSSGATTNSAAPTTYGTTTTTNTASTSTRPERAKKDYKNFVFGIYAGLNTTKFKGEAIDVNGNSNKLTGRLGYQAGFFVRGGGRLYGQLGAEYFASSSNYFTAGSGQSAASIEDQINIQYVQIPVYIGYKLVESDRGISAVRLQVGVEYANRINSNSGDFNLNNSEIKSGTFNGLGQLGFDAGPVFLDLTYHYGFSNAIQQNTGFAGSQRRILSASIGFKF